MAFEVTARERRWLMALVVLATIAAAFVVLSFVATMLLFFGDIILVFFLAWLLAFIVSPIASLVAHVVPGMSRAVAVVIVYVLAIAALVVLAVLAAQAMYGSVTDFIANAPSLEQRLPSIVQPWQQRLDALNLGQVNLQQQANAVLQSLQSSASQLVGPLQQLAVASLGVVGNLLLVVILSLYMAADRDRILSFLFRIVPPSYTEEARLLESSVARSFGGFLRGQAAMGFIYAAVAAVTSYVLGLDYLPVTTAVAGILMAIPFFGPFVAWAPPVLVAIVLNPNATIPALLFMALGWFVVMNLVQPRLMSESVGIHPIVVLGSVLVGSRLAGVAGAIFGIPVAAVLSSFFFYYLGRSHESRTVAARAASRLGEREGRAIRVPREPVAGLDREVPETVGTATPDLEDRPVPSKP